MKKINFSSYKIDHINFLIFSYIICYIAGPAIINIFLTLISIFSFFYFYKNKDKIDILKKDRSFIFFSIFFLYILLKDIFQNNFNLEFIAFLRIYVVFVLVCFYSLINEEKTQIKPNLIMILILILSLDSIFQYIFKYNIIGFKIYEYYRLTSFFENEPIIGSFIMKLFFPLFIFFLYKEKKDFLTLAVLLISIIVIFLSGERMPFLQVIFGITIFFLFFYKFAKKSLLFIFSSFFLMSSILYINPSSLDRYKDTLNGITSLLYDINDEKVITSTSSKNSIYTYYQNFKSGLLLWKNEPILGNGFRYYKNNCPKILNINDSMGCSTHPHNIYIEILSDYGLLGVVIFLAFLFNISYNFLKGNLNRKYLGVFITILVTSVPFVTSQSIFSSYYGSIYFLYIFILRYYSNSK